LIDFRRIYIFFVLLVCHLFCFLIFRRNQAHENKVRQYRKLPPFML
jgi:preprotein translocase subunit YajC